jgi:nucleotide-binding universal stress UspA family protein
VTDEDPRTDLPVVTGLDGSDCSAVAFRAAVREARERGCPLTVVHAWLVTDPGVALPASARLDAATEDQVGKAVHAHVEDLLADSDDVAVEEVLRYGYAGKVLADASAGAALLVVGSRGLGALRGALLGSVSQYVLEHAACPVLVVRQASDTGPRRVVAGVDGSAASSAALRWADAEARRRRLPLVVVHASVGVRGGLDPTPVPPRGEAAARLRAWVEGVLGPERAGQLEQVTAERPAAALLLELAGVDDLVVVGRSGTGGVLRLGSVARRLAAHVPGALVVIGPPA